MPYIMFNMSHIDTLVSFMFQIDVFADHKYSWVHGPKKPKNVNQNEKQALYVTVNTIGD